MSLGWVTIDGRRVFIEDKRAGTAAAVVVGLLVAVGGGSIGAGSLAGGTAAEVAEASGPLNASRGGTRGTREDLRRDRTREDSFRKRLRVKRFRERVDRNASCAAHAFGQVREFFLRRPCKSLDRLIAFLADADGNEVALSVVWVRMPSTKRAGEFKSLQDIHGSGDIRPLAATVLGAKDIKFDGTHYGSDQDGALVTFAETTAIRGTPGDKWLRDIATLAALLPAP